MRRVLENLLRKVRGRMRRRTFVSLVTLSYALLFAPPLLAIFTPGLFLFELTPAFTTFLAVINVLALGLIYVATTFVAAKRLQDMNKPSQYAVMTLFPGGFLLLLWIATQPPVDDKNGGNRYGRNPRLTRGEWRKQRGEHCDRLGRAEPREARPSADKPILSKPSAQKHVGRALHGGDGRARGEVQRFG